MQLAVIKTILITLLCLCSAKSTCANPSSANPSSANLSSASNAEPEFDLKAYRGKAVYLDFWASWCIPCRKSFPWMNRLRATYSPDELVIIAVNLDKDKALAKDFLQQYPADFSILYDPQARLAKRYQIQGMPSSVLFDSNGKAIALHTGFFVKKIPEYETQIRDIVAQAGGQ